MLSRSKAHAHYRDQMGTRKYLFMRKLQQLEIDNQLTAWAHREKNVRKFFDTTDFWGSRL